MPLEEDRGVEFLPFVLPATALPFAACRAKAANFEFSHSSFHSFSDLSRVLPNVGDGSHSSIRIGSRLRLDKALIGSRVCATLIGRGQVVVVRFSHCARAEIASPIDVSEQNRVTGEI
jgi:hypothetical protein